MSATAMGGRQSHDYHALPTEQATQTLNTNPEQGLTSAEVNKRLEEFGRNELKGKPGKPAWLRFLLQFNQALLYILLVAGLIKALLAQWTNAGVIWGVTVINAIIGFIQESKAEGAIAALAEAVTTEAAAVFANLEENVTAPVLSADQNIASLGGIRPNSFLPGDYYILTDDTDAEFDVNTATRDFQYSQSGDNLVSNVEVTDANQNQSVSFTVTDVDDENNLITFSYQYKAMNPGDGTIETGTGTFTVDLDDPDPFVRVIGGNTYELSFNEGEFAAGDRLVVNTNAAIDAADNADLVQLYRDGDSDSYFTYAFNGGELDGSAIDFEFFSLDQESGALLESSMNLSWVDNTFETNLDPDAPAAGFSIEQLGKGGTYAPRVEKIAADGLQNGTYSFKETTYYAEDDFDSDIEVGQQYLQGSAASIITGSADPGQVELSTDDDWNASVLLEVRSVDYDTGEVRYDYTSHEYGMDGTYDRKSGTFTLTLGGDALQAVSIGNITVDVEGLDNLSTSDARGLELGDRAVLDIRPAMADGDTYQRVNISGDYRGGESEARFIFGENVLQGSETDLRFFSLDTFGRSPEKGRVYDGVITADDDTLELLRLPQNLEFNYDRSGFPVYYGDSEDRIQEISPHQEVIMNLHGERAFGEYQEVFEAAYDVYWALIDNDREALGGEALGKMDRAIDDLLENLSQVGARTNRVEAMESTLFSENIHLREVRSNIEDIDLALVITEFMMQENAYRAALSTANMMMQPSLVDYMR